MLLLKSQINVRVSEAKYTMTAGDILLINCDEIHSFFECEEGNICLFIQFSPGVFWDVLAVKNRRYYFHLNSCDRAVRLKSSYSSFVRLLAQLWLLKFEKAPGQEFLLRAGFYQLLGDLFAYTNYDLYYTDDNLPATSNHVVLEKLTRYIEQNYVNDLSTDEICRHIGMSRSTLYRFMQSSLGLSLNEFIRYYRIEQAKKQLVETGWTISHISALCGYQNEMTFYRSFKKETGKTPQDFRKAHESVNKDMRIQGYVAFNIPEATQLIQALAQAEERIK